MIQVDPSAPLGLQEQLYAGIRRAILDGRLPPGSRLPSSRDLSVDLGISRTTAVLAVERLRIEGYLSGRRRRGTFVAPELPDDPPLAHGLHPRGKASDSRISARGAALAATPPAAWRVPGGPRPFRLGVPALDLFPVRVWNQLAIRRLRMVTASELDYGDATGLLALRQAIAGHVQRARGSRIDAGQVFVVAGAQRAVELIAQLLLDPGDRAWLEEPGYPGARQALLAAGADIVPVPVDREGLDVEAGERLARNARLVYVTPSHQFPMGVTMSLPRRLALLRWASAERAWVVEDDYDAEFRHGARPLPCLQGLDTGGRVIYVGSFAKTLFPSLRLGFLVVPPGLVEPVTAARCAADLHTPTLMQSVLADFIEGGHYERHLRRMRTAYGERADALVEAAERHCGGALRVHPVRTGLHAVADLVGADDLRVFGEAASRGVEVMPLSAYYLGAGARRPGLILGFGPARPERLDGAMEKLAAAIETGRHSRDGESAGWHTA